MKFTEYERMIKRNSRNSLMLGLLPLIAVIYIGSTVTLVQAYRKDTYTYASNDATVITKQNVLQVNKELHNEMNKADPTDATGQLGELLKLLDSYDVFGLADAMSGEDRAKFEELYNSEDMKELLGIHGNTGETILSNGTVTELVSYFSSSEGKKDENYLAIVKALKDEGVTSMDWSKYEIDGQGWVVWRLNVPDVEKYLEVSFDKTGVLDWHII